MRIHPTEFAAWWRRLLTSTPGQPPAPLPFTGTAQLRELDFDGFRATGIHIEAGPDTAPASAASAAPAPKPAATAASTSGRSGGR
jgi:hypothetical protein